MDQLVLSKSRMSPPRVRETALESPPTQQWDGANIGDSAARQVGPVETAQIRGIHFTNYSNLAMSQLYRWFPHKLSAERVVFFPDVSPVKDGKRIPSGSAVLTSDPDWRFYAVSDVGCGMQLLKSSLLWDDFKDSDWSEVAKRLHANKGGLGDLGGGNHFLDAIVSYTSGRVYFLIHTGSRRESFAVEKLLKSNSFDEEYARVVAWAKQNRDSVASAVQSVFGQCESVLDLPHNTYQHLRNGQVLIRKGTVQRSPGDLSILPSHINGDIALVEATEHIRGALDSVCHGTGRSISRTQARATTDLQEIAHLRRQIAIPELVRSESLLSHSPKSYRPLDECLSQLGPLVRERDRFAVIGFIGHL